MKFKMDSSRANQTGFTLIEIAIVLLIVTILLGYTVALFPIQQELKQYRAVEQEMDEVIAAIVGFAQVNGRLPCPAIPTSLGNEDGGGVIECNNFGGFVPVNTLGFQGRLNDDSLLMDPWGNPYRYYVSSTDNGGAAGADFVVNGDMQAVGLVDQNPADTFIDLDGEFHICLPPDALDTSTGELCDFDDVVVTDYLAVFGRKDATAGGPYGGAPFVLISHGKDWNQGAAVGDQLLNMGATNLGGYLIKNVGAPATTFVKRTTGLADDFDDVVKWVSPNLLFSKMIEAGQLP